MTDVTAGVPTPASNAATDANVPGASQPVPGSGVPTDQSDPNATAEGGDPSVKSPKTLTEDEHKALVDKRVAERLSKERRRLERTVRAEMERDFYKSQLERGSSTRDDKPATSSEKGKPKASEFETPDAYLDARIDWEVEQRMVKLREESSRETKTQRDERRRQENAADLVQRLKQGAKEIPDYEQVTGDAEDVEISDVMARAIAESDIPARLNYHLCANPEEADRISKLPPTRQAIEIGKLEDKLKAAPKPTNTPAPIRPNGANGSIEPDPSKMSYEKWLEWRETNLQKQSAR